MDSIGYLWIQSVDGDTDTDDKDSQGADDGDDGQSANEED